MSEELAWRAAISFEWEQALGELEQAKKTLAQIVQGSAEAALDRLGWRTVTDFLRYGGEVYLPPGRLQMPESGWSDPNKPSPPLPPPKIVPDPEFVKALAEPIVRAVKAALNKESGK
jgi:hypothetical protein